METSKSTIIVSPSYYSGKIDRIRSNRTLLDRSKFIEQLLLDRFNSVRLNAEGPSSSDDDKSTLAHIYTFEVLTSDTT